MELKHLIMIFHLIISSLYKRNTETRKDQDEEEMGHGRIVENQRYSNETENITPQKAEAGGGGFWL